MERKIKGFVFDIKTDHLIYKKIYKNKNKEKSKSKPHHRAKPKRMK